MSKSSPSPEAPRATVQYENCRSEQPLSLITCFQSNHHKRNLQDYTRHDIQESNAIALLPIFARNQGFSRLIVSCRIVPHLNKAPPFSLASVRNSGKLQVMKNWIAA